jgi:REP element-mobilizing transposase RayT
VRHESREGVKKELPHHITLKVVRGLGSLRKWRVLREIEASFRKACSRPGFRLVQYSIQDDHAHLIVEADDAERLACGMKSISARFARAVNRALGR